MAGKRPDGRRNDRLEKIRALIAIPFPSRFVAGKILCMAGGSFFCRLNFRRRGRTGCLLGLAGYAKAQSGVVFVARHANIAALENKASPAFSQYYFSIKA